MDGKVWMKDGYLHVVVAKAHYKFTAEETMRGLRRGKAEKRYGDVKPPEETTTPELYR